MTDALQIIAENTARFAGGRKLQVRYYELINKRFEKVDTRTGDEIAKDIITKAGLLVV